MERGGARASMGVLLAVFSMICLLDSLAFLIEMLCSLFVASPFDTFITICYLSTEKQITLS